MCVIFTSLWRYILEIVVAKGGYLRCICLFRCTVAVLTMQLWTVDLHISVRLMVIGTTTLAAVFVCLDTSPAKTGSAA